MDLLVDIAWYVALFVMRCVVVLFATPIILLWPRHDHRLSYWQTVRKRYAVALASAFLQQ